MIRYADIAINLTDLQFSGIYHGKQHHQSDRDLVIQRAKDAHVEKMLVTSSCLEEASEVLDLCRQFPGFLYSTAGVHPCQALDIIKSEEKHGFSSEDYYSKLAQVVLDGKQAGVIKAFGEIGLDYDRLHFAPADVQRSVFQRQLDIAAQVGLPLFLHSRAAAADFESILFPYLDSGKITRGGVVHSFTGTVDEMKTLVAKGLYIGINGCSLKTQENLDVVKHVPLSHLMLETDGPWCEIRPSHASFKLHLALLDSKPQKPNSLLPYSTLKKEKFTEGSLVSGRCEPCAIGLVAQVVASVKEIELQEVIDAAWKNSMDLFQMD